MAWHTKFEIKMSHLIVQIYKLSRTVIHYLLIALVEQDRGAVETAL